ncbi:hypothetical protein, partial [Helicobacter sp. MIT 11-5569]|uniref:hypothetical protein n=1 Tax=Helicobacter sp. MIT 11-5569 TaxID=1548151 RepID=UPI0013758A38
ISNSNLYANYSNSYLSLYNNSRTNDKTELDSTTTTTTTQESKQESIKDNQNTKEKLYAFISEYSNIDKLDLSLIINNDALTSATIDYRENIKNQAKNSPIPSQEEFQTNLEFLFGQIEDILIQGFNENKDSKEFQSLLAGFMMSNRAFSKQSYEDSTQDALQALWQLKNGNKSNDFKQKLSDYMTNSNGFATSIADFFHRAEYFNQIPQNQKNTIQNALEKVQTYLLNQAGALDNKSFKLGDAVISWSGDDLPFKDYYTGEVKIAFMQNNSFLSHLSNFDSTQSLFDILEKRDKLEKENQELKTKQAYSAYGITNATNSIQTNSTSDSLMQALLKESKESKKS